MTMAFIVTGKITEGWHICSWNLWCLQISWRTLGWGNLSSLLIDDLVGRWNKRRPFVFVLCCIFFLNNNIVLLDLSKKQNNIVLLDCW